MSDPLNPDPSNPDPLNPESSRSDPDDNLEKAPSADRPELPDRLSTDPDSPYYDASMLGFDIGIRFKGVEKTNVEEYCVSEGWVRLTVGTSKDRRGKPMTVKLQGEVVPYFR